MTTAPLEGKTIVVTGVTGQVAEPVAMALAGTKRVIGAARFRDEAARGRLEEAGVECVPIDLSAGQVDGLPADAEYVLNFAVAKSNEWTLDLDANSGGLATLMEHHQGRHRLPPLLDHRGLPAHGSPRLRRGRPAGRQPRGLAVPADLQHLQDRRRDHRPVGRPPLRAPHHHRPAGRPLRRPGRVAGRPSRDDAQRELVPVHVDAPSVYHPIHQDDILALLPGLLAAAATPATTVNWGGDEAVSIEEWCGYLAELTGLEARFEPTDQTIDSVQIDLTRMHELIGTTTVPWREGMRRMVAARHPELLDG